MTKGDYQKLLEELALARGRDLPDRQGQGIITALSRVQWRDACSIVRDICRAPNLPSNIYGAIIVRVDEIDCAEKKREYNQNTWIAGPDALGPGEWFWFMQCIQEIITWHQMGLSKKNPVPHCEPCSVEEWISRGRPKTWSPIVDHMMHGSEAAYKQAIGGNAKALESFFATYLSMLKTSREKRTAQAPV